MNVWEGWIAIKDILITDLIARQFRKQFHKKDCIKFPKKNNKISIKTNDEVLKEFLAKVGRDLIEILINSYGHQLQMDQIKLQMSWISLQFTLSFIAVIFIWIIHSLFFSYNNHFY